MCLGEIARVLDVHAGGRAVVEVGPRTVEASLVTLDSPVAPGDWLLVHAGFALARLEEDAARDALAIRSQIPGEAPR